MANPSLEEAQLHAVQAGSTNFVALWTEAQEHYQNSRPRHPYP